MFPKSKRPAPKPLSWRSLDTFCYFCSLDAFCYFLLATPRDLCYNDKEFSRFFHFRRFFGGCFHVHDAQNPSSPPPADPHPPAYPHPASALPRPPLFSRPALKKISFFFPPPHPKPGPPHPKGPRTQKAAGPSTGPAALSSSFFRRTRRSSRQYAVFPSICVYVSNSLRQLSRSNSLTVSRSASPARYS